jgi:hypothetical protein
VYCVFAPRAKLPGMNDDPKPARPLLRRRIKVAAPLAVKVKAA